MTAIEEVLTSHRRPVTPTTSAGQPAVAVDQSDSDAPRVIVDGTIDPADRSTPVDPAPSVGGATPPGGLAELISPPVPDPLDRQGYLELRVFAECFEDAQRARISLSNRITSGTVPRDVVQPALDSMKRAEQQIALAMKRCFRRVAPEIHAWAVETPGIGEHSIARLLGVIGHPVVAFPHHWEGEGADRVLVADEPFERNVAKLWSYCGHGDPSRRKAKGMSADEALALGSPRAKMLVHLIAECAMKCTGSAASPPPTTVEPPLPAGAEAETDDATVDPTSVPQARRRSPYRDTYDNRRLATVHRDDWTDAHKHNDALRVTGKSILRDLWIVAYGSNR